MFLLFVWCITFDDAVVVVVATIAAPVATTDGGTVDAGFNVAPSNTTGGCLGRFCCSLDISAVLKGE